MKYLLFASRQRPFRNHKVMYDTVFETKYVSYSPLTEWWLQGILYILMRSGSSLSWMSFRLRGGHGPESYPLSRGQTQTESVWPRKLNLYFHLGRQTLLESAAASTFLLRVKSAVQATALWVTVGSQEQTWTLKCPCTTSTLYTVYSPTHPSPHCVSVMSALSVFYGWTVLVSCRPTLYINV